MVRFGDIEITWLTNKDTSISKDVVEKNFVDEPPKVFELTANLESGTYSAILNETVHEKNESFSEQKDAVLSMVDRHGTEFPFSNSGDSGYVLVNSANTTDFPSLEIREAELNLRYLDDSTYRGAVKATPEPIPNGENDDLATPVESVIAFPSDINVLNQTEDYTITGEDGNIDLYTFDSKTIFEYDEDSNDQTLSQKNSICRLFNSSDERLYSDAKVVDNGSYANNGIIEAKYRSSDSPINYYNGSSWDRIGEVTLSFDDGYSLHNYNDKVHLDFTNNIESMIYRGIPAIKYVFSGVISFNWTFDGPQTTQGGNDLYRYATDDNGHDIIQVIDYDDGNRIGNFAWDNLTEDKDHTVVMGVIPDSIDPEDYARYLYNLGRRERTFTQK